MAGCLLYTSIEERILSFYGGISKQINERISLEASVEAEQYHSPVSYTHLDVYKRQVKGQGCKVWDDKGQEYLDLYGGHAVISIGHCHPHYVETVSYTHLDVYKRQL